MKTVQIRIFAVVMLLLMAAGTAAAAPTTAVHVVKLAPDQTTVLNETTVDYQWMEANLPVLGNGVTRYYHQGPVFEGEKWDPSETVNFKDRGAVKGTNVKDLCNLAGGAAPGDEVMIRAADGYHVEFAYENVYVPDERQGPIGICWYNGADSGAGERQGTGYVPDYYLGMRLVFFADNSSNADGLHVYGNQDMYETLPESAQHFYDLLPSTSGLSIKWVDEVRIYSGGYTGDRGSLAASLDGKTTAVPTRSAETPLSLIPVFGAALMAIAIFTWRRV